MTQRLFAFICLLLLLASPLAADYATLIQKAKIAHIDLSQGFIEVSLKEQRLRLWSPKSVSDYRILANYPISSAQKGIGQYMGSEKTPLGLHRIQDCIGANDPLYTIFKAKKNTHKIWNMARDPSGIDLILTRILPLEGMEPGFNKGKDKEGRLVDSYARGIFIHGTAEEKLIGKPSSHGCLRMRNADVLVLFEKVHKGMAVWIHNGPPLRLPTLE